MRLQGGADDDVGVEHHSVQPSSVRSASSLAFVNPLAAAFAARRSMVSVNARPRGAPESFVLLNRHHDADGPALLGDPNRRALGGVQQMAEPVLGVPGRGFPHEPIIAIMAPSTTRRWQRGRRPAAFSAPPHAFLPQLDPARRIAGRC